MTEVTLESLQADFEAARETRLNETYGIGAKVDPVSGDIISLSGGPEMAVRECHPQAIDATIEEWAEMNYWWGDEKPMRAARRYIIARDFNEFDPQRADMLFKLTYGGSL